jgi:hypothetical protein
MVRTVITPKQEHISIELPKSFIGKEVEVIAFTTDEGLIKKSRSVGKRTFTVLNVEDKNFKFNRDEANER